MRKKFSVLESQLIISNLLIECPYCGFCGARVRKYDKLDIDHIVPVSQGGNNELSNLRLSHTSCNRSQGSILAGNPQLPKCISNAKSIYTDLRQKNFNYRKTNRKLANALREALTWIGQTRGELPGENERRGSNDERRRILEKGWDALKEHPFIKVEGT